MPITETNTGVVITEIALPSVVAWEWSITEDATIYRHQIVWLRGTAHLRLGTQRDDGTWITITIDSPERFGDLSSLDGARAAAHNFIFDREPGEGPRRMA